MPARRVVSPESSVTVSPSMTTSTVARRTDAVSDATTGQTRKNKKTERDLEDWKDIKKFFDMESHKGYPFNWLTPEEMGIKYI